MEINNRVELIQQYVKEEDADNNALVSKLIADILDFTDEHMIDVLNAGTIESVGLARFIKGIDEEIANGGILENAPWLPELKNRLIKLNVFVADAEGTEAYKAAEKAMMHDFTETMRKMGNKSK
ncbi:MAG: hypothetical protein WCP15_00935 [bacterium]